MGVFFESPVASLSRYPIRKVTQDIQAFTSSTSRNLRASQEHKLPDLEYIILQYCVTADSFPRERRLDGKHETLQVIPRLRDLLFLHCQSTNRFDFSGGKGLIRPNKNLIASTTLDIMRGQGMKYVHAITDGRQGVEGDLEKSKRQIKRYKEMVG